MDLLRVENLTAGYKDKKIIENVSFSMEDSEFIGLLGLNGSGKTTLLKTISGLLKPLEGESFLNGEKLSDFGSKERARRISYMSQSHSIVYDITVMDVVLMGATPYLNIFETPGEKHKEQAYRMLEIMGMEDRFDFNFNQLSEGQKQLVIIARNLMQDARLMLFDEPDSALDFTNKHMVLSKIKGIVKGNNRGGIITLHDPNYALTYCDRIILIEGGGIFADFKSENIDAKFLKETFHPIYGGIDIIKHEERFILVKE